MSMNPESAAVPCQITIDLEPARTIAELQGSTDVYRFSAVPPLELHPTLLDTQVRTLFTTQGSVDGEGAMSHGEVSHTHVERHGPSDERLRKILTDKFDFLNYKALGWAGVKIEFVATAEVESELVSD